MTEEKQQELFLNALFQATQHDIELRIISKDGIVVGQHFNRDHKKIKQIIKKYGLTHNIFFGVFTREGNQGKAENVREGTCIFADMDFKNYKGGQAEADEIIKKYPVKPSLIIHSGNGYHLYWLLSEIINVQTLKDKLINTLRGIAYALMADTSVADIARVLRMPGTFNHKSDPPKPVNIININEYRYSLDDFKTYEISRPEDKTPLRELYQGVPEGQRNDSLARLVGSWANDKLTLEECLENAYLCNSKNDPPLPEKEVKQTVKSIFEKYHRELSYCPPLYSVDNKDNRDNAGISTVCELDLSKALRTGRDLQILDIPIQWAIKNLIPLESITLLPGKGGMGKTTISIQVGDAISREIPFIGHETIQRPVIYVDFENSLPVLIDRIKRIGASEVSFWHTTNEIRPPRLDSKEWELYKQLPKGAVLIFDTLRASQSRDENDSQHMAFIMQRLKKLRDLGFTIILLHHTPKSNERIYKGSTAIFDLSDHVLGLYKVRKGNHEEIDEDDDTGDSCYRLGTRDKTRYEPYHIFLEFDKERGVFVTAPDPDTADLEAIQQILEEKGNLNTNQIFETVKTELDIKGKAKVIRLLKKGEGKYWTPHRTGRAVYYEPIGSVSKSPYIYRETIRPISENATESVLQESHRETTQSLDTSQQSYSPEYSQTDKTNEAERSNSPEYIYSDHETDDVINVREVLE